MAWYADLTPCTYFDGDQPHGAKLLAVGWLEHGHAYQHGVVDSAVLSKLVALFRNPWEPCDFLGWHDCDLCQPPVWHDEFDAAEGTVSIGISNLFVPGTGVLYAAPSLILHYIAAHGYAPPEAFCTAVLACPPMGSEDYLQAISRNGPAAFATWAEETPRKVQYMVPTMTSPGT